MGNRHSHQFLSLLLTCTIVATSGCGSDETAEVYQPAELQGEVDPNASANVQVSQRVLITLFDEIMQRIGAQYRTRDIVLNETDEQFFEGAAYLQSWSWDGPADGNDLGVKLVLLDDDEQTSREVTRIYTVTTGRPATVTRKQ